MLFEKLLNIFCGKGTSRLLGFAVTGEWMMLCACAIHHDWSHFVAHVDSAFAKVEQDHCQRCFWEEVLRHSRRSQR